jgi:hypothetical protein
MSVTAAEAAQKALGWAEAAELGTKAVDEQRSAATRCEGARDNVTAVQHRASADGLEMYRERAVVMATMWAHVAGALQATQSGGQS